MMCLLTLQDKNGNIDDDNPIGDETSPATPIANVAQNERPSTVATPTNDDIGDTACTEGSSLDTTNKEQFICGICLDPLGRTTEGDDASGQNYNRKKFGLLTACDHIFCIHCLRTWRYEQKKKADDEQSQSQQSQQDQQQPHGSSSLSQKVRACPECRQVSDFVVPSDRYVTGIEKQKAISEYQARLSCIPCKRFDGNLGSCPFGKDCFYAHYSTPSKENNHEVYDMKHLDKSKEELWQEKEGKRLLLQHQRRQISQLGRGRSRLLRNSVQGRQNQQPSIRYDLTRLMIHDNATLDAIIESNDSHAFYQYLESIEMFQQDPQGRLVVGGIINNNNNEEEEDDIVDDIESNSEWEVGTYQRYSNPTGGDVPMINPVVTLSPQYVRALFQGSRFIDNNNSELQSNNNSND
jgi:hypothetical protein